MNCGIGDRSWRWLDGKISGKLLRHHPPGGYREIEAGRIEKVRIEAALGRYDLGPSSGGAEGKEHGKGPETGR